MYCWTDINREIIQTINSTATMTTMKKMTAASSGDDTKSCLNNNNSSNRMTIFLKFQQENTDNNNNNNIQQDFEEEEELVDILLSQSSSSDEADDEKEEDRTFGAADQSINTNTNTNINTNTMANNNNAASITSKKKKKSTTVKKKPPTKTTTIRAIVSPKKLSTIASKNDTTIAAAPATTTTTTKEIKKKITKTIPTVVAKKTRSSTVSSRLATTTTTTTATTTTPIVSGITTPKSKPLNNKKQKRSPLLSESSDDDDDDDEDDDDYIRKRQLLMYSHLNRSAVTEQQQDNDLEMKDVDSCATTNTTMDQKNGGLVEQKSYSVNFKNESFDDSDLDIDFPSTEEVEDDDDSDEDFNNSSDDDEADEKAVRIVNKLILQAKLNKKAAATKKQPKSFGSTSLLGARPENQDCAFHKQIINNGQNNNNNKNKNNNNNNNNNNTRIFGVLDGHGDKGEVVSVMAKSIISNYLHLNLNNNNTKQDDNGLQKCIIDSFEMANKKLIEYGQVNGIDNGTTATVAVVDETTGKCMVGWSGDSMALIVRYNEQASFWDQVEALTHDHRPEMAEERDRIEKCTGRLTFKYNSWRIVPKQNDFTEEELVRKRLALNTSRSLGHYILSRYGVSAIPSFATATLHNGDYLIVASDGLTNAVNYQTLPNLISSSSSSNHPQKMSAELCRIAVRAAGKASDNVTISCYQFQSDSPTIHDHPQKDHEHLLSPSSPLPCTPPASLSTTTTTTETTKKQSKPKAKRGKKNWSSSSPSKTKVLSPSSLLLFIKMKYNSIIQSILFLIVVIITVARCYEINFSYNSGVIVLWSQDEYTISSDPYTYPAQYTIQTSGSIGFKLLNYKYGVECGLNCLYSLCDQSVSFSLYFGQGSYYTGKLQCLQTDGCNSQTNIVSPSFQQNYSTNYSWSDPCLYIPKFQINVSPN
ncbi:protein phosphatase 2C [Cavenderia fasciculata]|uniref:Protein phosphatase 2C n=1 Tax=Cavenderia fasciculata TaxID=261658 RepID=F4PN14_CACFS|nr:protein phosphatase 2C [Cavenderia fasciculata]EGG22907.1 protein phosphatase 2C [Cavenderia fasciculata]|eukprot:XP_004360758.1 protein phosphatase 2C [Cavenderia fasciculata]